MTQSLGIRLKYTIFSVPMLVSVLLGVCLLMWNLVFNLIVYNITIGTLSFREMGTMFLEDIYTSHARSGFDLFAPILAVLPSSTLFCDDYTSGYLKSIISRIDPKRYAKETVICSSISGGLAVFLPSLITSLFYLANGNLNKRELLPEGYVTFLDESVFSGIQFVGGGLLVMVLWLVLAFLFGALWSNVGLCLSTFFPNRYFTLASPFILYFAMHLIFYRVGFLLFLSPVNMLIPVVTFIRHLLYPFLYQFILTLGIVACFSRKVARRIENV